jgi:uncharacterized protein (DUF4415 family)
MIEREPRTKSDLARVDRHEPTEAEYDDAPELTAEQLAEAAVSPPVRGRGRPPIPNPKQPVKLRLDRDIVEGFKATGPGWQTRINNILGQVIKRDKSGRVTIVGVKGIKEVVRTKSKPVTPRPRSRRA